MEYELQVGDTIRCSNADEMVDIMTTLETEGYRTEFVYEKDGVKGLWLLIEEIPNKEINNE